MGLGFTLYYLDEEPLLLGVILAIILFVVIFSALRHVTRLDNSVIIVIAFVIVLFAAMGLYKNEFYGLRASELLGIVLVILVIGISFKILQAVFRSVRVHVGR